MTYNASVRELLWFAHTMLVHFQTGKRELPKQNIPRDTSRRNILHVLHNDGPVEYFEHKLEQPAEILA